MDKHVHCITSHSDIWMFWRGNAKKLSILLKCTAQQNLAKSAQEIAETIMYIWKKNVVLFTELYQIFVWDLFLPTLYTHARICCYTALITVVNARLSISIWKCLENVGATMWNAPQWRDFHTVKRRHLWHSIQ